MRLARMAGLCAALLLAATAMAETIGYGTVLERELQPGQTLSFELAALTGYHGVSVQAQEQGVDLELRWDVDGRSLRSQDGDFLRTGIHVLAANVEPGKQGTLQVRAERPGTQPGRFRLRIALADLRREADALRHSADLLETEVSRRIGDAALFGDASSVDVARQLLASRRAANDDAATARAVFLLDQLLRRQNQRADAIALLQGSLPLLQRTGDAALLAAAHNNIGMSHWRLGDGRRAEEPLRTALDLLRRQRGDGLLLALVDSNLCLVVTSRNSVDGNVRCSEHNRDLSIATGDFGRISVAWNNLAGAYSLAGRSESAAAGFLKAIEFGERAGDRGIADPQMNLGLERYAQGRFEEAGALYARAEAIYRREDNQRNIALILRHRAQLARSLGDIAQAANLLREALAIQRKAGRRGDVVQTLTRLGELELRAAARPFVPDSFTEAVRLAEIDANPRLLGQVLLRLSDAMIAAGDTTAAQAAIERVQPLADGLHDDYLLGMAQWQHARILLAQQNPQPALAALRRAQTMSIGNANTLDVAEMYALEARILLSLQRSNDAQAAFQRGIDLVERARNSLTDAESRARFLAAQQELYAGLSLAVSDAAFASGDEKLRRDSLTLVARQRSRSLLEQMERRQNDEATPQTDEYHRLAAREIELASARWLARERNLSDSAVGTLDDELRQLARQLAALEQAAPAPAPVDATRELEQLLQEVGEQAVVVHYWLDQERSYAWVAGHGQLQMHKLPPRPVLDGLVAAAREAAFGQGRSDATALAALCDAVWQPLSLPLTVSQVLLVADGSLQAAPWPALLCKSADGAAQALIENYEISLTPSLQALQETRLRQSRRNDPADTQRHILAVVDPLYQPDDPRITPSANASAPAPAVTTHRPLPRLQATAREAQILKSLNPTPAVTVLAGAQASRDAFAALDLRRYRLIHLGLHGVAGTATLADAGLIFSLYDTSGASRQAFLNARSIARLELDADLVVLAACDSAVGATLPGEGLMGTSYAFLAAGAKQVIATLAPASDSTTSRLMEIFYRENLQRGATAAQALRKAQREVRSNADTRHPRYWAGFVVYGVREIPSKKFI